MFSGWKLVTNTTMLEYMLVRNEDRPILDQSQGRLRWIVIDEAHTYIGSHAAELTLLLRRVLHAFGCSPNQVHFIATSATMGTGREERLQRLQGFLADVAGVIPDRVSLIFGERSVPSLPSLDGNGISLQGELEGLKNSEPEALYELLASNPDARKIRAHLVKQASKLSTISSLMSRDCEDVTHHRTLAFLDLCTRAVNKRGDPFLPLRGHIFQRALNGVWACSNFACTGRRQSKLDNPTWSFGKIFLERMTKCDACGSAVFEVVQCMECGQLLLSSIEKHENGLDWLQPSPSFQEEDEFQQELEPLDEEESEEEPESDRRPDLQLRRLLGDRDMGNPVSILPEGQIDWDCQNGNLVYMLMPDEGDRLQCPCCLTRESGNNLFAPIRLGAPFLLQTAIPILLNQLPPYMNNQEPLPHGGRRLLSFTDSRQGTARFAAKLQLETERNFVRSLLYHTVFDRARPPARREVEEIKRDIAHLEQLQTDSAVILRILEEKRQELIKLESPPIGRLAWTEAADRLLGNDSFRRWLLPPLQDQTFGLTDRQLAELCLWREFFYRPKRQISIEGLGLLSLGYSKLLEISKVPAAAAQCGITLEEWRSLVQVALDFHIRGNKCVAIPNDAARWLGYAGKPSIVIGPYQERLHPLHHRWPSAATPTTRRGRLVRLLAHALQMSLDEKSDQRIIEEVLLDLWNTITLLINRTEHGYHLDLGQQADIVQVREAWFCPVTRRLLSATFRNITPYLPQNPSRELSECIKVEMPLLPKPFWLESTNGEAERWLETDSRVLHLRELGVWTDISDRIAAFAPYFYSTEHSAQIPGTTLTQRENAFKAGKINLLSCSTTMELGVDIGGLTTIAMNNVPPHPANFLQRAGRAARRGETTALSFTLCKSTPHGEAVFRNPLWPFTAELSIPYVSLQSRPIVQRHINSMALSEFLGVQAPKDIWRLSCGWFFEGEEGLSAPWLSFHSWCRDKASSDDKLLVGLQQLTRRTILEGISIESLLSRTAEMAERTSLAWLSECQALLENLEIVKTRERNSKAEKAVGYQLERIRKEYLLGELAGRSFLPSYGFATGVVSLVTTTLEQFERTRRQRDEFREDNRIVRAGYPSRALPIAIRDYAPGTDTVLDGRVYRCGGLTLNWQLPAELEGPPEIQSLRWVWRCSSCGGNGTRNSRPSACPHCGERSTQRLTLMEYIQPAGFAVDIRWRPHNDITKPQYIPVRDPLVSMGAAEWLFLPSPVLGRYRFTPQGALFYRSDGLHEEGFAVCLRCGMADSMLADGRLPEPFADHNNSPKVHKRLRGGRNNDQEMECPGSHNPWAIKTNLRLGANIYSEVIEFQLNQLDGRPLDRVTAYSLGVALRRALAKRLGIEEGEIGSIVSPSRNADGDPVFSIHIFDTAQGGAGYVAHLLPDMSNMFREAKRILECPRNCDRACHACLLTYETQYHLDLLDRMSALSLLNDRYLDAFKLPLELQAFGNISRLEMEPLPMALHREMQWTDPKEIRLHLRGKPEDWEPMDWRMRESLVRIRASGCKIFLVIPSSYLAALSPSQADEMAAIAAVLQAEIICPNVDSRGIIGNTKLYQIMEIGSTEDSIKWASSQAVATAPNGDWGSGNSGAQFVLARYNTPLKEMPTNWTRKTPTELRRPRGDMIAIKFLNELDGPIFSFGERAWTQIFNYVPELKTRLDGNEPISAAKYSDRYLRSPLALLLLRQLLGALSSYPGGIKPKTQLEIFTSKLSRNDNRIPRYMHHDWHNAVDRRQFLKLLFGTDTNLTFSEFANNSLQHARELNLCWANGSKFNFIFDQGMGYWREKGKNIPFHFDKPANEQIQNSISMDIAICSINDKYPTYWYVKFI